MIKILTSTLIAFCTVGILASCANQEPAPNSASQPSARKQQNNVDVGAASVNESGRGDPSVGDTGQSVDVGQENVNDLGRSDTSGASTGVPVQEGNETVNEQGR